MNLLDFLQTAGSNPPAPFEPVSFEILHQAASGESHKISCNAVLVCISEKDRQKAMAEALKKCRKDYSEGIPPVRLAEEERYHILAEALRDADDTRKAFTSVGQLRASLVSSTMADLWESFTNFLDREFPPVISKEEFAQLVEDAKKKSLGDLLSSMSSAKMTRSLPGLVYLFANSQTETSGDGER